MDIRRTFILWSQLLAWAIAPALAAQPPNVVVVVLDDVGWQDIGALGSDVAETPRLDQLARDGVLFTRAYANGPNCPVSRASLLTGQYPTHHGVYGIGNLGRGQPGRRTLEPPFNREALPRSPISLAEALAAAGYASAYIGKWQLGDEPAFGPTAHGFDVSVAAGNSVRPQSMFSPYGLPELEDGPPGEYLTDRLTREAIAFIDGHREQPFLLVLSHYAAHPPLQADAATTAKYESKLAGSKGRTPAYFAMIEALDRSTGQLVDALAERKLAEQTLLIVVGDNGPANHITTLAPLRGSKGMLLEGALRVPLLVHWPAKAKAGARVDTPVMVADLYPTVLAASGAPAPVGHDIDGTDLRPLLDGSGTLNRSALFWHFPGYVETGLPNRSYRMGPTSVIHAGNFKLLENLENGRIELYDLASDPGERRNIAYQQHSLVDDLHRQLQQWRSQQRAAMPLKRGAPQPPWETLH